jgi:ubiquinone/menaquinone biosynthesis C-methylase UbiE
MSDKHEEVKKYYSIEVQTTSDLKTSACCTTAEPPKHIKSIMSDIHDEVMSKYYGCGLTIPTELAGLRILDLGSGSGRDCFIASALVGEQGEVIGVDMTDEQLAVANAHIDYHAEKFGYKTANTRFYKGNIEALDQLDLEAESFDLIISNCVINLAVDKEKVLRDAYRLLKPGGELYFSDVYADRRISKELQNDSVLWGECLSGALYWNDFLSIAKRAGFKDPRAVSNEAISIENKILLERTGNIKFYSVTYRLFKMDNLEPACEDYGQAVAYKGSIKESPFFFDLDDHHHFPTGKIVPVCGNSFMMLSDSRFRKHFEFFGNFETHYGIFEGCGTEIPFKESELPIDKTRCC